MGVWSMGSSQRQSFRILITRARPQRSVFIMNIHQLIDQFVRIVDPSATLFLQMQSVSALEAVEEVLPKRFPVSYQSLVTRYRFPAFDAGGIQFFPNSGDSSHDELAEAIFADPIIANMTHTHGFIQFGRPADGSYDPICFDARSYAKNREYPIVRLDHEDILSRNKVGKAAVIADSFYRFASDFCAPLTRS